MDILLIYYSYLNLAGRYEQKSVRTDLHKEALINARKDDKINLYHYDTNYSHDEYREIDDIKYNGNVKYIYLRDR